MNEDEPHYTVGVGGGCSLRNWLRQANEDNRPRTMPYRAPRLGSMVAVWALPLAGLGVTLLLILVTLSSACTSDASGTVLWSSGFESGDLSEWTRGNGGGVENSGTGTVSVSTDVAHSGRYSGKLAIANATNQTQAARLFRWGESENSPQAYYSVWYYFPREYSGMIWWNVFQWKSKLSSTVNDPLWILNVDTRSDGSMYFYLYDWINRRAYSQRVMNIPVGRWFQVEAYYQQATDNTGRVTFWQDGTQIFDLSGIVTKRPGDEIDWSVTNYTDNIDPPDAVIYVDDAAISTVRLGTGDTGAPAQAKAEPTPPSQQTQLAPRFVLGFKTLADLLGSLVGQPVENEHVNPVDGNTVQHTTAGLMVWRKADGASAFTDGSRTWVNGPYGLQVRSNDQRFPWERG
jgi:hypothetical protein